MTISHKIGSILFAIAILLLSGIGASEASAASAASAQDDTTASSKYSNQSVKMNVQVHLRSADSSQLILVEDRIWDIPLQKRFSGFLANMSVEVNITRTDSVHLEMKVFITTIGSRPDSRTQKINYELGLPARINNIRGKAGATYEITFTPAHFMASEAEACKYNHRERGSFSLDPTANFDIHFVKGSLGDYHWNKMKELLESEYLPFKKGFDITHPGKVQYYMYPCATNTVAWDSRFGFSIDPTRSQALGIYNHDYMAPGHLIAILTQVMRVYGHAPPFLSEGISGYFHFFDFETLSAIKDSAIIPLQTILTTQGYYKADPILATAEAASFCRFLADTYGIDRFRTLYNQSDDLNIEEKLKELYLADIATLESRWVDYLLKMQPRKSQFLKRARLEGATNNIEMAISVLQSGLAWDTTLADTLATLVELGPFYAEAGRYEVALKTYKTLYDHAAAKSSKQPYYLLRVGYFNSILGNYEDATKAYQAFRELDTGLVSVAEYNLVRVQMYSGDTAGAIERLQKRIEIETDPVLVAEAGNSLGLLLGAKGKYNDPQKALDAFERAANSASYVVKNTPNDGANKLRLGVAYMGLGEYVLAHDYLTLALFLEFRPRHLGSMLIALANLADLQGDRKLAIEFYNRAKSIDKSIPGQSAASDGLKRPFALKVNKPPKKKASGK